MQAVVERRISLVPEEHRLFLELAAVAGREPDPAVLQGVLGAELVERGLAVCADLALFEVRRNAWRFTHDKFREAVLQQLEAGHARDLHRTVAETMERLGAAGEQYATLAYHFRMVGDLAREARYSELAGRAATEKGSYKEARALLERALELRAQFPERNTTEELDLLLRLGSVLIPLCGWAAAEVRRNYDQAVELAVSIGREADVAPALIGLGMFFFLQGQLSEGRSLARRCLELPGAAGDPITRQHACLIQGDTAVWLGEFASDLHYADEIAQIYRPEHLPAHLSLYGMNPRLSSMVSSTVGTWMIGYPDQALERSRRTGELAQQDGNPFSTAIGYQLSAWVHCLRGDAGECLTDALFLGATSAEHGFPLYQVLAQALEGWALARQGEGLRGVDKIREAIQTWKGLNARLVLTFYSTLLADACLRAKLTAAGLAATEAALGGRLGTEERCYMPELHRLRGELLLQAGDSSAGIEAFEASLAVAAEQQARSFEFRAAISLARAAAASARAAEARRRLFQICAWFDDKGETPDLQAARQVLFSVPRG
jgi:predicted ATPase